MQTHKILILDDHQLFADGLALILSTMDEQIETTISSDALEALGEREFLLSHDLVLIDLHMPKFTGFGFLTAIQTQEIPIDCLLYTSPSPRDRTRSRMPSSA